MQCSALLYCIGECMWLVDITWAVDRLGKYTSIALWIILQLSQGRRMRLVHIQQWCGWISQLSTVYRVRLQDFDSCCLIYFLIILKYIFETETSHMSRETMEEYLQSCVRSGQPVRRIGERWAMSSLEHQVRNYHWTIDFYISASKIYSETNRIISNK